MSRFRIGADNGHTAKVGQIVPIYWCPTLPGETLTGRTNAFCRVQPMLAPIMSTMDITYVTVWEAYRNLWTGEGDGNRGWQDFVTSENGDDTVVHPTMDMCARYSGPVPEGSVADWLGITPGGTNNNQTRIVSPFPLRMYQRCWNYIFRDQTFDAEQTVDYGGGLDTTTALSFNVANLMKDPVTTARPTAQAGDAVLIPGALTAPVITNGQNFELETATTASNTVDVLSAGGELRRNGTPPAGAEAARFGDESGLIADLEAAFGSIDELEFARKLQAYYRLNSQYAIGGETAYSQLMKLYYKVAGFDQRFSKPVVISKRRSPLEFGAIYQTTPNATDGTTDPDEGVASIYGHGDGRHRGNSWRFFSPEHGMLMVFAIVRPRQNVWMQGLHKELLKRTKEDYFIPILQNLGQRTVSSQEVYADQPDDTPNQPDIGYQMPYYEYKNPKPVWSGELRSSLNMYHVGITFAETPAPGEANTASNVPMANVMASNVSDQFILNSHNQVIRSNPFMVRQPNPLRI